jgi:choline dehydrogenase/4-pyridoxate dehydrogenase
MLADAYFRGKGLGTALPAAAMAFLRTKHAADLPDVQLMFVAAPATAGPYLAPIRKPYIDGFAVRAAVLRPESRGSVELASANPARLAVIRQNFLTRDKDWKVLREGLRLAHQIGQQKPLADFVARQVAPTGDSDQRSMRISVKVPSRRIIRPVRAAWVRLPTPIVSLTRSFGWWVREGFVSSMPQ